MAQLYVIDPDNAWNAVHVTKAIDHDLETDNASLGDHSAAWILQLAKDPNARPQLADQYLVTPDRRQLAESYAIVWPRARHWQTCQI